MKRRVTALSGREQQHVKQTHCGHEGQRAQSLRRKQAYGARGRVDAVGGVELGAAGLEEGREDDATACARAVHTLSPTRERNLHRIHMDDIDEEFASPVDRFTPTIIFTATSGEEGPQPTGQVRGTAPPSTQFAPSSSQQASWTCGSVPSAPGTIGGSYVVDNEGLHCIRHALVVFLSGYKLYST